MATSPERVRVAFGAARTFSDLALDALREAVLLIDTRQHHKPVLLANAAARRFFADGADSTPLLDSCLYEWLRAAETEAVEATIAGLSRHQASARRIVTWRSAAGETPVMTDFKLIDGAAGQRIVMLNFAAIDPKPELLFAIDMLPMDLLILDRNLKITYANAAAARSAQFPAARLLGCSALTVSPTAALSINVYRHALAGTAFRGEPVEFLSAGGTTRWYEIGVQPLMSGPCVVGLLVVSTDVTERCLQTQAQSASERRLRALTEYSLDVVAVAGPEGQIQYLSGGLTNALGADPSERRWRNLFDSVHVDDVAALRAAYRLLIGGESGDFTQEVRIEHRDGSYRWFESTCIAALDNPLIGGVVVVCRDVTARKQAERQLREREEISRLPVDLTEVHRLSDLLAETQCATKTGGWEYLHRTGELTWTDELYRIFETTPAQFTVTLDSALSRLTPESRDRLDEAFGAASPRLGHLDLELEILTLKSQRIWVRLIGHFERPVGGAIRVFGSLQSIHAQKLAQIALESRTDWLRLSINLAQLRAWRWNRDEDVFEYASLKRTGALPHRYPGIARILARMHPDDRAAVDRAIDRALATGSDVHEEFRLLAKDGHYRRYATTARPLLDAARAPCGLVGVTQDITASRQSEIERRHSEELLRATTENAADTLMLLDGELEIRFVNRPLRGRSVEQMSGSPIERFVPEAARERVTAELRRALESGEAVSFEFEDFEEAHETRYFECRAVRVEGHGADSISLSVRDITECKRLAREILEVSGRERQRIGRDLHDGLGQELTGIALMMRGLARRLERECPEVLGPANEIVALVNQSIDSTRRLARGLLPVSTEQGGLLAALQGLADRCQGQYGFEVRFNADPWPELRLEETQSSHLFRIAQEALTNAARHAQASVVEIALTVAEDQFRLKIVDNGCGMSNSADAGAGLGTKIMAYRANIIGARLEMLGNPGGGTIIQVTGRQPSGRTEV